MDSKSFAKNIENNYFAEILLVATSEPRMILILFLKFDLFEPRPGISALSSKFLIGLFQGFSSCKLSDFTFLLFTISCFLETPLSGCFRPATITFS